MSHKGKLLRLFVLDSDNVRDRRTKKTSFPSTEAVKEVRVVINRVRIADWERGDGKYVHELYNTVSTPSLPIMNLYPSLIHPISIISSV
jgi:hypothetical protein